MNRYYFNLCGFVSNRLCFATGTRCAKDTVCLIKKMGLESWAKDKATAVNETYFNKWWSL